MSYPLPEPFSARMRTQLSEQEATRFLTSLDTPSPVSIRYNPYKIDSAPEGERVPWCRYGYYLEERPLFTLDTAFHGGLYYVQEAGSMFIEHLVRESCGEQIEGARVLDLCAAPGGKSTLLSTLVGPEGVVVSNEVIRSRAQILSENVRKWGIANVVVSSNDPAHFAPYEHYFDLVLVDTPCSGEGMFRKNPEAREQWSEKSVELCASRSRRILSDIWGSLRPGGVLIYSTCTFNEAENEQTLLWLNENYEVEPINVPCPESWGVVQSEVEGFSTFRFYPHRLRSEGFFATILRKGEGRIKERAPRNNKGLLKPLTKAEIESLSGWVSQSEYMSFAQVGDSIYGYYTTAQRTVEQLSEGLSLLYSGVRMGQLFGKKLRPDHALALFHDLNRAGLQVAELTKEEALDYLRKGEIPVERAQEGINLVCCEGVALGWVKRIGRRINNMYPKELRIANL